VIRKPPEALPLSILEVAFLCMAVLLLYHFYRSAAEARKRGKGLLKSGRENISSGHQELREGHKLLRRGLVYYGVFLLILLALTFVLVLRACVR